MYFQSRAISALLTCIFHNVPDTQPPLHMFISFLLKLLLHKFFIGAAVNILNIRSVKVSQIDLLAECAVTRDPLSV